MSGKSDAQKLRVEVDSALWLSDVDRVARLEPLPERFRLVAGPGKADCALIIADSAASLRETR